jgi:hypothetical protein
MADLSMVLTDAARELSARGRRFTADDLMTIPAVAEAFPVRGRLASQAQYLVDCAWLSVAADRPQRSWALGPAWAEPR